MSKIIIALAVISAAAVVSANIEEIYHGGRYVIKSGSDNFGVIDPDFLAKGFSAASVNGEQVTFISADCQQKTKPKSELSEDELKSLIFLKDDLERIRAEPTAADRTDHYYFTVFSSARPSTLLSAAAYGFAPIMFGKDVYAIYSESPVHFSGAKVKDLSSGDFTRAYSIDQLVAIVREDETLIVKPKTCLSFEEEDQLHPYATMMSDKVNQVSEQLAKMGIKKQ